MSRAGILLRVLLSLALVLNGIGGAVAASAMAAVDPHSSHQTIAARAGHSGCHEHAGATSAHSDSAARAIESGREAPAGHADCWGVGLGGLSWARLPSLGAMGTWLERAPLRHDHFVAALARSRPAPTLPHLIRPPIS